MAKVIDKYKAASENYFDNDEIVGECSKCGTTVHKSRCGCDEECPNCGEWLDWDFEEPEEEPKEYWYEPKECEW